MSKYTFIFPGQGVQYPRMGRDFYDAFPIVRETFEEADDLLSENFTKLIFEGEIEDLTLTKNSQVAIFIVSSALYRCVRSQFPDIVPSICAGLSLGEYTALFATGRISFAECLKLVHLRGQYMHEACLKAAGTMSVVLGLDEVKIAEILPENVWIANLNCPGQVVIAGLTTDMVQAEDVLKLLGAKRVIPLDVAGAFHTPLMHFAQEKLAPYLITTPLKESDIRFVMNVPGTYVDSLSEIRQHLIAQVISPTHWEKGIREMQETKTFLEIGPGKTLTGMNRKIGVAGESLNIETITDLEKLHAFAQS